MLDFIMKIFDGIMSFIEYSGTIGALVGCFLILIESIFPVLPLVAFITINFLVFGKLVGFLLSWIFTILGCIISYFIFKKGFGNKFEKLTEDKATLKKYKHLFKNITVTQLVLLIAMPFTPAFMVNIAAGLVKMDFKKKNRRIILSIFSVPAYLIGLIIGKISLVYFWGFVGTSFVNSFKNPIVLVKIAVLLLLSYIVTALVNKVLKIE